MKPQLLNRNRFSLLEVEYTLDDELSSLERSSSEPWISAASEKYTTASSGQSLSEFDDAHSSRQGAPDQRVPSVVEDGPNAERDRYLTTLAPPDTHRISSSVELDETAQLRGIVRRTASETNAERTNHLSTDRASPRGNDVPRRSPSLDRQENAPSELDGTAPSSPSSIVATPSAAKQSQASPLNPEASGFLPPSSHGSSPGPGSDQTTPVKPGPSQRSSSLSTSVHITNNTPLRKVSRIGLPPPGIHAMPTPASTLAFDTQQELLWTGNEYVSRPFQLSKFSNQANITFLHLTGKGYLVLWP